MDLRLMLDDRDFDALVTTARSMIPSLASEWTDHNIHDPGIMLIELMAWVAEAQIYSLGRIRNDEKAAFARLLGVVQTGPRPARGLVWPLEEDEAGFVEGAIGRQSIEKGTAVFADRPGVPQFRLVAGQYLTPARLTAVRTLTSNGDILDHTGLNRRNGATFLPFGPSPTSRDRLELTFMGEAVATGGHGLLVIGVEVDRPNGNEQGSRNGKAGVNVVMALDDHISPVAVARDSTTGFQRSGVIALSIPQNEGSDGGSSTDKSFRLILTPKHSGFIRPPHIRRLAVNVLEVEQVEAIVKEEDYFGQGLPDQIYTPYRAGGMLASGLTVEINGRPWSPVDRLDTSGPGEEVYVRDEQTGRLVFGNGINGRMPPPHASLKVAYDVCEGAVGNAPKGVGWSLRGVPGIFGRNSQPFSHGSNPMLPSDMQSEARTSLSVRTTYVTNEDLEEAAVSMTDLGVARAKELPPRSYDLAGTRRLLVAGTVDPRLPAGTPPENPLWVDALRSRLLPHIPAGQRIEVVAPGYVRLRVSATLSISDRADPDEIAQEAARLLRSRFHDLAGLPKWDFGRDITVLQVLGWLRKIPQVQGVNNVVLIRDGEAQLGTLVLSARDLPIFEGEAGDFTAINRNAGGRVR